MALLSFLKGLLPYKFSKNEISKSCELVQNSLREHTLPAYGTAVNLFKSHRPKSAEVVAYLSTLKRELGGGSDGLETIAEALQNASGLLGEIDKQSDTLFADVEASAGLTYQKAAYLQIIGALSFANDYARKFLNFVYVQETAAADAELKIDEHLVPAETEYVAENFNNFVVCLKLAQFDFSRMEKAVQGMPDAVISELSEQTLPHTLGPSKIDPLGLRNLSIPIKVSVRWNPFYLIGTLMANVQVQCYKASKEEYDLLQLRKMNLEKLYAKQPDARLQKEIAYLADRVTTLNYELQQAGEKYGV